MSSLTDRHPFNSIFFQDSLGKLAPERLNKSGFNEARDDWVAGGNGISWTICKSLAPRKD